jgi:hypothetical protein
MKNMKKSPRFWLVVLTITLIVTSLACAALGGGNAKPEAKPTKPAKVQPTEAPAKPTAEEPASPSEPAAEATEIPAPGEGDYDTGFPLPEDVQNFMQLDPASDSINFQTGMSMDEVIAFYRQAFTAQGLVERPLLTVIEPGKTFSMVFDGAANGMAVVIQGVVLGANQTNVNIRYEDV